MLYSIKQAISLTSLSKSTIYRLIQEGRFPKPLIISRRRVGWRQSDIYAWLESCATTGAKEGV